MKISVLTLFGLAVLAATPGLAGEFIPVATIDTQKVKASPWCSWVEAAFWPTEATMRTRAYTGDLTPEKTSLIQTLQRVMKKEYLPTDSLVQKKTVGITSFRNGNDTLFLQYRTTSGMHIQVTAEKQLYLMVTVPEGWRKPLAEVAPLVWRTAAAVLQYPEFEGEGPGNPQFIIPRPGDPVHRDFPRLAPNVPLIASTINDIGKSKTGGIWYGQRGPSSYDDSWYSTISWWSDGQRVMFAIKNPTEAEAAEIRTMAAPRPIPPRVFQSRKAE